MLHYITIPVTPFQQNYSIIWCDEACRAAVIDPGGDIELLLAATHNTGAQLDQIWLTHAHIDHAGATAELAQRFNLPIIGQHTADQFWIDQVPEQGAMFNFPPAQSLTPTRWLNDGDMVSLGHFSLCVPHTIFGSKCWAKKRDALAYIPF